MFPASLILNSQKVYKNIILLYMLPEQAEYYFIIIIRIIIFFWIRLLDLLTLPGGILDELLWITVKVLKLQLFTDSWQNNYNLNFR